MNQTFNINRFGRYARYILSMNRWYYGILLVVCVLPATVLSLYGQSQIVHALTFCPTTMLMILPNIELSKFGGLRRQIGIPASWLEKLIVEIVVRYAPLAAPFGIHAVAVAFGKNGLMKYFADGFEIQSVAFLLCLITLMFLVYLFDNGQKHKNSLGKDMISTNLFMAVYFGVMWGVLAMNEHGLMMDIKLRIAIIIMLISSLALFVTAVVFYRKRKAL